MEVDRQDDAGSPVILDRDEDAESQRFSAIPAGRTGDNPCYYLVNKGRYVNSTSAHPYQPLGGSAVTMDLFRPNDDGYPWCTTPDGFGGVRLGNHTAPDERVLLTPGPASGGRLTVESGSSGASWALS